MDSFLHLFSTSKDPCNTKHVHLENMMDWIGLVLIILSLAVTIMINCDLENPGEKLGLPYPPPYADQFTSGSRLLGGVNYASAGGGILDETGRHFVIIPSLAFNTQILKKWFLVAEKTAFKDSFFPRS